MERQEITESPENHTCEIAEIVDIAGSSAEEQNNYGLKEYVKELKYVPDPLSDSKIEPKLFHEANDKIKLFKVIERNEDCHNNHINILTLDQLKNDVVVGGDNHSRT